LWQQLFVLPLNKEAIIQAKKFRLAQRGKNDGLTKGWSRQALAQVFIKKV
jgi:hypothetical protein